MGTCQGDVGKRWEGDQLSTGLQWQMGGAHHRKEVLGVGHRGGWTRPGAPGRPLSTQASGMQESNSVLCLFQESANFEPPESDVQPTHHAETNYNGNSTRHWSHAVQLS